jgi:hypothetical protein
MADSQNRLQEVHDYFDYPTFQRYSRAVGRGGDVLLLGVTARQEVIPSGRTEPERVYRQYVSGNVFASFGLQPSLGRLIGPSDDDTGWHPVAVLSHEYWTRRFGRDPAAIGTTFRLGAQCTKWWAWLRRVSRARNQGGSVRESVL